MAARQSQSAPAAAAAATHRRTLRLLSVATAVDDDAVAFSDSGGDYSDSDVSDDSSSDSSDGYDSDSPSEITERMQVDSRRSGRPHHPAAAPHSRAAAASSRPSVTHSDSARGAATRPTLEQRQLTEALRLSSLAMTDAATPPVSSVADTVSRSVAKKSRSKASGPSSVASGFSSAGAPSRAPAQSSRKGTYDPTTASLIQSHRLLDPVITEAEHQSRLGGVRPVDPLSLELNWFVSEYQNDSGARNLMPPSLSRDDRWNFLTADIKLEGAKKPRKVALPYVQPCVQSSVSEAKNLGANTSLLVTDKLLNGLLGQ